MAENVSDITIAVEAAGAEETQQEIKEVEGQLEESGEAMDDTAGEMEDLHSKMQGAGRAMAVALAAAAGGVLSQVPIIGGVVEGLISIFSALGFQLDKLLRKLGAEGLVGFLFKVSEAIFNLEGPLGTFVGAITGIAVALGTVGGIIAALPSNIITLGGAITKLIGGLKTLISLLSGSIGLAVAIGAVIGAIGVWVLEVTGVLDEITNLGSAIRNLVGGPMTDLVLSIQSVTGVLPAMATAGAFVSGFMEGGFSEGIERATQTLNVFKRAILKTSEIIRGAFTGIARVMNGVFSGVLDTASRITKTISGMVSDITTKISGMIGSAYRWGKKLIEELIDGMKSKIGDVGDAAGKIASKAGDKLSGNSPPPEGPLKDIDQPGITEAFASGIEANVGRVDAASQTVADAADPRGGEAGGFVANRGGGGNAIKMDGRMLTKQDGRYRRDETARRGRDG